MRGIKLIGITALLSVCLIGETLGYLEQKFNSINFEKGKWSRADKAACFVYTAKESNALLEIMRFGTSNLVPFRATKEGLTVIVCGSTAAFDEGFEARAKP
jgi:hypothetical protein